eukprot:6212835-Pleurochrysis_carterae.AAC.1
MSLVCGGAVGGRVLGTCGVIGAGGAGGTTKRRPVVLRRRQFRPNISGHHAPLPFACSILSWHVWKDCCESNPLLQQYAM